MSPDVTRAARTDASLLKGVPLAWPTVALSAAALTLWLGAAVLALGGWIPLLAAIPLAAVAAFVSFTPMHDASHRSVALRWRWLNEVVGRLAGLPLMAPFVAFRCLHLEHHKHTNESEHDPDLWSGSGPRWLLPLRWATQDLHYYVAYSRARRSRPPGEVVEVVGTLGGGVAASVALVVAGYGAEVLCLWLVPARLATAALAFSFDYLPHRPHTVTSREDRYQATHNFEERWLTPFFLWQNYHLVHHLYPGVPFYRYGRVYRARRAELEARGAREISVFAPRAALTRRASPPRA